MTALLRILLVVIAHATLALGGATAQMTPPLPAVEATPVSQPRPAIVKIGAYLNDINQVSLRDHTFTADIYIWFRWTDPGIDPADSFEFMNLAGQPIAERTSLYEQPVLQQGRFYYQLVRYQGAFSTKFHVGRYPFDSQTLRVQIEDDDMGADELVFEVESLAVNPGIVLPGYRVGEAQLRIVNYPYQTAFGDLMETDVTHYSRAEITVPVTRPWISGAVKTLLPVALIILCAAAALLLGANQVEARVGLAITSLLALVALQFSMGGTLPEVGYLLMLDQIFIASYLFVLFVIIVIVAEKRAVDRRGESVRFYRNGLSDLALVALYFLGLGAIIALNMRFSVGW